MGHSLFTYYLFKGLKGEGDRNGDAKITAGELESYLDENVPYAARRLKNREQVPRSWGDKSRVLVNY